MLVAQYWSNAYDSETYFKYIGEFPEGILGMNVLNNFNMKLNFDNKILELYERNIII